MRRCGCERHQNTILPHGMARIAGGDASAVPSVRSNRTASFAPSTAAGDGFAAPKPVGASPFERASTRSSTEPHAVVESYVSAPGDALPSTVFNLRRLVDKEPA